MLLVFNNSNAYISFTLYPVPSLEKLASQGSNRLRHPTLAIFYQLRYLKIPVSPHLLQDLFQAAWKIKVSLKSPQLVTNVCFWSMTDSQNQP